MDSIADREGNHKHPSLKPAIEREPRLSIFVAKIILDDTIRIIESWDYCLEGETAFDKTPFALGVIPIEFHRGFFFYR